MTKENMEVRAPHSGEWIAVDPNPKARLEAMLINDDGHIYMVAENMVEHIAEIAPGRMTRQMLFIAQNRAGDLFLWPVPMPVADDHPAYRAMETWIRFEVLH